MGSDMGEIFSVAPGGAHLGMGTCAWHCMHFSMAPVEHGDLCMAPLPSHCGPVGHKDLYITLLSSRYGPTGRNDLCVAPNPSHNGPIGIRACAWQHIQPSMAHLGMGTRACCTVPVPANSNWMADGVGELHFNNRSQLGMQGGPIPVGPSLGYGAALKQWVPVGGHPHSVGSPSQWVPSRALFPQGTGGS